MQTPSETIQMRNRVLCERTKKLGDQVYSDGMRLVVRPNVDAKKADRWGFDVWISASVNQVDPATTHKRCVARSQPGKPATNENSALHGQKIAASKLCSDPG